MPTACAAGSRAVRSSLVAGTQLDSIEQWFVDRGLPHFVERHDTASADLGRALPLLVFAYLLLGFNALDLKHWSRGENVAAAASSSSASSLTWFAANRLRGRRWLERPRRIGRAELVVFTIVPAVPSIVVGQWGDAAADRPQGDRRPRRPLGADQLRRVPAAALGRPRTVAQLAVLFNVVVRALPLLLLFTTFLFINAEVWQVAGTLTGIVYVAVLAIFFLLGAVFVLSRVPTADAPANEFDSWAEIGELVDGTPADVALRELSAARRPRPHSTACAVRQRLNIGLVTIFSQAIQITARGAGPDRRSSCCSGSWPSRRRRRGVDGARRDRRARLVDGRRTHAGHDRTAAAGVAFLGTFSGMYFTVLLSTDAMYREEFAEDVAPQLRQALAVRRVYRRARAGGHGEAGMMTPRSACSTMPIEMRRVLTALRPGVGGRHAAARRRAGAGHRPRRRLRRRGLRRRADRRRLARLPRPPPRRARPAQPRHRAAARRAPHRARPGAQAAPAGVGGRARAGVGDVDVRPARAAQRVVQPRRARAPTCTSTSSTSTGRSTTPSTPATRATGCSWRGRRRTDAPSLRRPARAVRPGAVAVPTPDDIVALRRTDPAAAHAGGGGCATSSAADSPPAAASSAFTRSGEYVVDVAPT